ncbi:DUF2147 domain-containing protein [Acetobacter oeni]|nr:DUF2147 domain-containing protein [Acetobacter oeni]
MQVKMDSAHGQAGESFRRAVAVLRCLAAGIGAVLFLTTGLAYADPAPGVLPTSGPEFGYWLSEKHDGVFHIARCGEVLCGTLVGLLYGPTEPVPKSRDGRSECGLTMLTGFTPMSDDPGRWAGRILDPDTGNVYHAQIWSPQQDVLKLRGYVMIPIFGETQTWTRYTGTIGAACRMPQ